MRGACSTHDTLWSGNLRGGDHLEVLPVDVRIIIKCVLKLQSIQIWNGFIWLKIGTSGGLLWARQWTSGSCKRRETSSLFKKLSSCHQEICFILWTIMFVVTEVPTAADSDDWYVLGCDAVHVGKSLSPSRTNVLSLSSRSQNESSKQPEIQNSAYSWTTKMEKVSSSESSVEFDQPTRRHIPKDSTPRNHSPDYLKSALQRRTCWPRVRRNCLFTIRFIWNVQIHCVRKMRCFQC
jgi:hypothetical protein